MNSLPKIKNFNILILAGFLLPLAYWIYLLFNSRMEIRWDSLEYQSLGILIQEKGWKEYFITGPNREPVYPALVALAMAISNGTAMSDVRVLAMIQLSILFVTQVMTLVLLKRLKVHLLVAAGTVLYLGLSPALVNSALSMYSEIAVYPFVLTIVLLTAAARVAGRSGRIGLVFLSGAGSGAFFFFATLVKGVFEGIAPCFLVAAVLQFRPHPRWTRSAIVFAAAALLVFYNGLSLYKAANLRHNGNYTLTNRGAWALYGNTARRTQVMDKQLLLAAVAYAPGEGFCKSLLDDEACRFWSAGKSDEFGFNKLKELESRGLSGGTLDKELLRLSVRKAGEAPLQYGFFGFLEAAKMLFWETTKLGFVTYPVWLEKLFDTVWLKNGLRLLMGILTLAAIVFAAVRLWTGRRKQEPGGENELIYPVLLMVLFFAAFHAPFFVLTRYILPLAPLYLVLIAVLIDSCFNRRS